MESTLVSDLFGFILNYEEKREARRRAAESLLPEPTRRPKRRFPNKLPSKQRKARAAVQAALASGKLVKPSKCESCDQEEKLQAHHWDYAEPLDVSWLCRWCHERWG